MPSPLGHALGGFAAGWLVAGPGSRSAERPAEAGRHIAPRRSWLRGVSPRALAFAALGMAADVDLLIGRHSQFTHSVGMTVCVALGACVVLRLAPRHRLPIVRLALAVAAAYGSHVLLDWLAQDATPPRGITALWPFSSAYYLSRLDVFAGISRQPWLPGAAWHDVLAVAREVALLGSLALGAWWLRRRRPRQILPTATRTAVQPLPPGRGLPADGESR